MKRIGLLSDTHGWLHPETARIFQHCDEIWHAGDIGSEQLADELLQIAPLRAVYGNIDSQDIRMRFPAEVFFTLEGVRVLMTHIGGYPRRYTPALRQLIDTHRPGLVVCGHSHILKIMYDKKHEHLHMNPGAAGKNGFHKKITFLRFSLHLSQITDLEVVEFSR